MAFGLPRVPGINASAIGTGILGSIQSQFWNYLAEPLTWGIYEQGSDTLAIEVDSVLRLTDENGSDVSTYPIVNGSFASYNKVNRSSDYRITLTKSGNPGQRKSFLDWLAKNKSEPTLFDIVTPETTYKNVTLINFTNRRDVRDGTVTMIMVDCAFQEVRQVPAIYYKEGEGKADTSAAQKPEDTPVKKARYSNPIEYAAKSVKGLFNNLVDTVSGLQDEVLKILNDSISDLQNLPSISEVTDGVSNSTGRGA